MTTTTEHFSHGTRSSARRRYVGTIIALLAVSVPFAAHAQGEQADTDNQQGKTVGHVQMGVAFFDRAGTLADDATKRGFSPFGGGTPCLGFVRYLEGVPWLGFGAGVRGTFGNSAQGDREYFFNPILVDGGSSKSWALGTTSLLGGVEW